MIQQLRLLMHFKNLFKVIKRKTMKQFWKLLCYLYLCKGNQSQLALSPLHQQYPDMTFHAAYKNQNFELNYQFGHTPTQIISSRLRITCNCKQLTVENFEQIHKNSHQKSTVAL